ncbi:MAG TPA: carboxypeptidase-like regulatory domain-containing protein [Polyangiaceae bacterium]|nr:carboxypeptidase-like regulatory domain-containing protein [Polyangiaceae bacterium]
MTSLDPWRHDGRPLFLSPRSYLLPTLVLLSCAMGCAATSPSAAEPSAAEPSRRSEPASATASPATATKAGSAAPPAWKAADPDVWEEGNCIDALDNDQDGRKDCEDPNCQSPGGDCVAAPPLDRTVASTMVEMTAMVFIGENPLQRNVKPGLGLGTAAIFGTVRGVDGKPLPGVRISIEDHPELGYTYTRAEGRYDLVVYPSQQQVIRFDFPGAAPVTQPFLSENQRWIGLPTVDLAPR